MARTARGMAILGLAGLATLSACSNGSTGLHGSATAAGVGGVPRLFVSTGATPPPGELYTWPHYPKDIQLHNSNAVSGIDWISGIDWEAGPQRASGTGTVISNPEWAQECNGLSPSCFSTSLGTVKLTASQPETCTVKYASPTTGAHESARVRVFGTIRYHFTSVNPPAWAQYYSFGAPCE